MNQFPWGLRMTKYEEQLGADLIEHGLAGHNIAKYSIEKKLNVKWVPRVLGVCSPPTCTPSPDHLPAMAFCLELTFHPKIGIFMIEIRKSFFGE